LAAVREPLGVFPHAQNGDRLLSFRHGGQREDE